MGLAQQLKPLAPGSDVAGEHVLTTHRGPVTGVAMVPNSSVVLTSGYDSAIGWFDLETGQSHLLGYHHHLVNSISVNASGTRAASCSSDYSIVIWDLQKQLAEKVLLGHSDDVEAFIFVNDGVGVSASRDHRILVWNLDTGAIMCILQGHEKDVLALAHDAQRLYSSGDDMTLRVWDLESGELLNTWGPFDTETDTCSISPGFQRAVLGCDDGYIRIFDTAGGELIKEIKAHSSGIKKVSVAPPGCVNSGDILSAAYDQQLIVWDAHTLKEKARLEHSPTTWERSLAWSPDGNLILSGTFSGTVQAWSVKSGRLIKEVGGNKKTGNACFNDICSTGTAAFATVSDDGRVRLGHLSADSARWQAVEAPADAILMNAITADPQRNYIFAGAHNHCLQIFLKRDCGLHHQMEINLQQGPINTLRVSRVQPFCGDLFVGCYSGNIVRVDTRFQVKGHLAIHEGAVKSLRLHPDFALGISCGADGILRSWNYGGEIVQQFMGHRAIINDLDFSPDGKTLASVGRDFTLNIFELDSGKLLASYGLGSRSLKSVCYWDARRVFIGDYWGTLLCLDMNTGKVDKVTIAHNGLSALTRLGDQLLACSYDGCVYLVCPEQLQVKNHLRAMQQHPYLQLVAA